MPGMNRRGPEGDGPMSGRGQGRCNPSNRGSNNFDAPAGRGANAPFRPDAGRGLGQGQGQGMGRGQGERMRRRDGSGRRRMG
jgi:hypothetical protein